MVVSTVSGEITVRVKLDGNAAAALELLQFLTRSENAKLQVLPQGSGITPMSKKKPRPMSKEQLSKARTLSNPLLYKQLCNYLERLNGDSFNPDMIDRTLERGEALSDLKRKYPQVVIYGPNSRPWREDYREYLAELGLTNKKQQDLVISRMESNQAYSDAEIIAIVKASNTIQEEPMPV